jgi:hypothetical protein
LGGVAHALAQVWDLRAKRSVQTLNEEYQVTAVAFAEAGDQVAPLPVLSCTSCCASHVRC